MRTAKLGDLVEIIGGGTPDRSVEEYWGGDIPWASVKDFKTTEISQTAESITERGVAKSATNVIPAGSIIVPTRMAVGKAAINVVSVAINQDLKALRPKEIVDCRYLLHALLANAGALERQATGATVKGITLDVLRKLELPLPSIDEQRRIAAILDLTDELRRKGRARLVRTEALYGALFAEMFGHRALPGKSTPLVKIGDRLDFLTSGSRGWAAHYSDTGSAFLRIQNVKRDKLDANDLAHVSAPDTAEAKRTRVQPGDVLLSITADLGRTAVVPEGIGEAYISQHLAILRSSAFVPRYLSAALASPAGQRAILRRNREGVKAGLNFDDVRSLEVPDVEVDQQVIFTERAAEIDTLVLKEEKQIAHLDALFASLQHRAFTGQLTRADERWLETA